MEDTFKTIASPPVQPQDDLQNWQEKDTSRSAQDRAAFCLTKSQMLFGLFRKDQVNNPELYAAGIAAIFQDYPMSVVEAAVDPRTGIAIRCKYGAPNPADIKEFCDEELARQHRMLQKPLPKKMEDRAWNWVAPPGCKYAEMVARHGRPIGAFEIGGYLGPSNG